MAKLKAHGKEIGRINYGFKVRAVMSDGVVLVNHGGGYKIDGRIAREYTPEEGFALMRKSRIDAAFAPYWDALIKMGGTLHARAMLHLAVTLMPSDPDGIWSQMEDGSYETRDQYFLEEIVELCRHYRASARELDERKRAKAG